MKIICVSSTIWGSIKERSVQTTVSFTKFSSEDKASPKYEEGISCSYCFDSLTEEKRIRQQEKWRQLQLKMQREQ